MNRQLRILLLGSTLALPTLALAHGNHGNPAPWLACDERPRGAMCAWENADGDLYRGTCQAYGEHLMCVRNQPIQETEDRSGDAPETSSPGNADTNNAAAANRAHSAVWLAR